ncbi:GIY-YIG nuclease family protein [Bosea sp. LjRoot9]|uniref:GIY-YIG nuclease family protein n=1 Tax=Bosea sp. LjRoot9 TaxID=3342341 RepID=UPI003ECE92C9
MLLNDLLGNVGVDPTRTLVLRHRPMESRLAKALPLIASERPHLFNIFQSYQGPSVERSMLGLEGGWLASFIAYGPAKAAFVGIYKIGNSAPHTREQFWACPENQALAKHGYWGFTEAETRTHQLRFDLTETRHYADWRGKLIVGWPPPERGWYRRAHNNIMPVLAIREESAFATALPEWDEAEFTWAELSILPQRWRAALEHWRGIYAIWDSTDAKTYVGSAYGRSNILGRWEAYGATGHGGNKLLRERDPSNFRFTILQRVSPDMLEPDVMRLERTWKNRLHTRAPYGLNKN